MNKSAPKLNSTEKVLEILVSFLENQESWGVRELASKHGFAPGTVQRILTALKKYNFIEQNPTSKKYQLGLIYFKFFNILQTKNTVIKVVRSSIEALSLLTKETICHHIIKETYNLCIDKIQPSDTFTVIKDIGAISPLYVGASSKCLLAFSSETFIEAYLSMQQLTAYTENTITDKRTLLKELELIRNRGYSQSISEKRVGIASVSAPIFDHTGSLLGAVSVDFPESKFYDEVHRHFCIDSLLTTVREISQKFKPE